MKCKACGRALSAIDSEKVCNACLSKAVPSCVDCGGPIWGMRSPICNGCSGIRVNRDLGSVSGVLGAIERAGVLPTAYERLT